MGARESKDRSYIECYSPPRLHIGNKAFSFIYSPPNSWYSSRVKPVLDGLLRSANAASPDHASSRGFWARWTLTGTSTGVVDLKPL